MEPSDKIQAYTRRCHQRMHCLRRDLGLDDDTYRDLLASVAGVRSSKGLDAATIVKVIERMTGMAAARANGPGRPGNMATKPRLKKIGALLAEADRSWEYSNGIAKKMYGVERCEWCTDEQLRGIITALVRDAARHGRRT